MNQATIKAIEQSVAKYRLHALLSTTGAITHACTSAKTCPLCQLFYEKVPITGRQRLDPPDTRFCVACPVCLKTGKHSCYDTPYEAVGAAQERVGELDENVEPEDIAAWQDACTEEADFLQSLLPK